MEEKKTAWWERWLGPTVSVKKIRDDVWAHPADDDLEPPSSTEVPLTSHAYPLLHKTLWPVFGQTRWNMFREQLSGCSSTLARVQEYFGLATRGKMGTVFATITSGRFLIAFILYFCYFLVSLCACMQPSCSAPCCSVYACSVYGHTSTTSSLILYAVVNIACCLTGLICIFNAVSPISFFLHQSPDEYTEK